jgi:hypothetical protein
MPCISAEIERTLLWGNRVKDSKMQVLVRGCGASFYNSLVWSTYNLHICSWRNRSMVPTTIYGVRNCER